MRKKSVKKLIIIAHLTVMLLGLSACGAKQERTPNEQVGSSGSESQVFNQEDIPLDSVLGITDAGMDSIFAENESDSLSITIALPASNDLHTEPNQWYDRLVSEVNEYTGMDITWKWYQSNSYDEQIEKDILSGEVADIMMVRRQTDAFVEGIESGLFWEVGPYLDEYDNHAMTYETSRWYNSYNGRLYGLPRINEPLDDALGYRVDWLNKLGLEAPTDWESFERMLYAFTYDDPDGNGVDDTVGLVLDSNEDVWDIMEIWFGVPNVWGISENGDLIHKTMTQEYRNAYAAFRELYAKGLINNGSHGIPDFREYNGNWEMDIMSRSGSFIEMLYSIPSIYDLMVEEGVVPEGETIFDICACVDTGKGELCYGYEGGTQIFVITTARIKTEEQLKRVLQCLNDLNDAPCTILLRDGWEGISYGLDESDKNMKVNPWSYKEEHLKTGIVDARAGVSFNDGFSWAMTGFAAEENKYAFYNEYQRAPLRVLKGQLEEEYRDNCVINYGYPFSPKTQMEKGEELEAQLFVAEIQYITGEIDEAGFEAALSAWWENGGAAITEEINALYHAAGY